jgi:hypothetical protein
MPWAASTSSSIRISGLMSALPTSPITSVHPKVLSHRKQRLSVICSKWDTVIRCFPQHTCKKNSNPGSTLVMEDEMIVDMRSLPPDIQESIRRKKRSQKEKRYLYLRHVLGFRGLTTDNSQNPNLYHR